MPLTLPSSQTFCFVAACEKKQHELSVSLCYLLSTSVVRRRRKTDAAVRVQKLKFSLRSLTLRMKSFLAGFSVHFPLYPTAPDHEPLHLHPNHQGECRPNLTRTWYYFCSVAKAYTASNLGRCYSAAFMHMRRASAQFLR